MAAERDNELGLTRCRFCGSDAAAVRVSKKQLAYIVCNRCNLQVLARSDMSDDLLRESIIEPARRIGAANDEGGAKPAHEVEAKPAPAPAPRARGWGFLG